MHKHLFPGGFLSSPSFLSPFSFFSPSFHCFAFFPFSYFSFSPPPSLAPFLPVSPALPYSFLPFFPLSFPCPPSLPLSHPPSFFPSFLLPSFVQGIKPKARFARPLPAPTGLLTTPPRGGLVVAFVSSRNLVNRGDSCWAVQLPLCTGRFFCSDHRLCLSLSSAVMYCLRSSAVSPFPSVSRDRFAVQKSCSVCSWLTELL